MKRKPIYLKLDTSSHYAPPTIVEAVPEKPEHAWDFVVTKKQDIYYLVHVRYSTGDSFNSYPDQDAFPYLALTRAHAEKIKTAIQLRNDSDKDYANTKGTDYSPLVVQLGPGLVASFSTSQWTGYFEHLDGISVLPVMLHT